MEGGIEVFHAHRNHRIGQWRRGGGGVDRITVGGRITLLLFSNACQTGFSTSMRLLLGEPADEAVKVREIR